MAPTFILLPWNLELVPKPPLTTLVVAPHPAPVEPISKLSEMFEKAFLPRSR